MKHWLHFTVTILFNNTWGIRIIKIPRNERGKWPVRGPHKYRGQVHSGALCWTPGVVGHMGLQTGKILPDSGMRNYASFFRVGLANGLGHPRRYQFEIRRGAPFKNKLGWTLRSLTGELIDSWAEYALRSGSRARHTLCVPPVISSNGWNDC